MDARFQREADFRAEMDSRFQGIRNDMSYFADSMRFMDSQFETLFTKLDILGPDPTSIARPLPSTGPPFPVRDPSTVSPPRPKVIGVDPEEAVSSSSSSSEEDDDGDEKMAEATAKGTAAAESSSEDDDDEEDDDAGDAE